MGEPATSPITGERRFQLLVDAVVDYALYLLDPEGRVTSWNPGAERMKGYAPDDIIGRHFSTFFTEEDRAAGLPARALEAARREGRFEAEGWRVRKDGTRFWALAVLDAVRDETGALLGFVKITRDMTDRRNAFLALQESEKRFRLLVDSIVDYAIFMLDPEGRVANWNAGAERIKGYAADEIVGRHFSAFYTEEDRAAGLPARTLETARREGRYEAEGWRVKKDGTRFWAGVVVDAVRDEDGTLIGFAKITRDLTERREAELRLAEAREQLFQSQKLETIGRLTGGVAHDFNNLLTVVVASLERLARSMPPEDKDRHRAVRNAMQAADRAAALTQQLLAFARKQVLQPRATDANALIRRLAELLHRTLGEGIAIETDLAPDLWAAYTDPNQLENVLLNLAVNARDAMPGGGTLRISTRNAAVADADATNGPVPGAYVVVEVSDSGVGMTKEVAERAFEPFFTTKPLGQGSGLGLSQVYGFALQSRGHVSLDSAPGRGTTIRLFLPRDGRQAAASEPPGGEIEPAVR